MPILLPHRISVVFEVRFREDSTNSFSKAFPCSKSYGLSFDNYSPDIERLPMLADLASNFPTVPVIVNHLGGRIDPAADRKSQEAWRASVAAIAGSPNAVMKLGGAQQRVGSWEPPFHMHLRAQPIGSEELCELLYPYYAFAIEVFGPDRCMFESNFPVDQECVSYRTLWNTFKRIATRAGLSETEKAAVFSGTAARVYRLPPVS